LTGGADGTVRVWSRGSVPSVFFTHVAYMYIFFIFDRWRRWDSSCVVARFFFISFNFFLFLLFLTGGADGTVRVWSRGSVAGGGPSPTVETAYETYAREITQNVY
jgi:WD40 repeat protein